MASERSIDVDALLEPVPGDSPAGVDAREDAAAVDDFYEVKDARAEARSAERHAFETLEDAAEAASVLGGLAGQWAAVSEGAQRLLAERTKDLEIASWLTEALVRRHGFAGLRDGFDVMTGLVEGFWDGLHPRPDEEEGVAWTVAAVAGLNGVESEGPLLPPIRNIRLTDEIAPNYAFWHERLAEGGGGAVEKGEVEAALRASSTPHLQRLAGDLAEAASAVTRLDGALVERCGIDAPSLGRIEEELEAIQALLRRTVGDRLEAEDAVAEDAGPAGEAAVAGEAGPAVPGAIRTREEAFVALERVAGFFRRTEPHSPISYTLDEAVRRGRMSLPDLLVEVVPDQEGRRELMRRLGIMPENYEPEGEDQGW